MGQEVRLSPKGGTVTHWRVDGRDILFPQQQLTVDGQQKLRGGMHVCFPNFGTVADKYGLPQHGSLRTKEGVFGEERHTRWYSFDDGDLLGAARENPYHVRVGVEEDAWGPRDKREREFAYTVHVAAKHECEPGYTTLGFHPYFATPAGVAHISARGGVVHMVSEPHEKAVLEISSVLTIHIPGSAIIQMIRMDAFAHANQMRYVVWRDRADYVCIEPVLAPPELFGEAGCPRLPMHPEQPFRAAFSFKVLALT